MADTLTGHVLTPDQYYDVYNLFGLTGGTAFSLQNQGNTSVKIVIAATQPSTNSEKYILIPPYPSEPAVIPAGESGAWVLGDVRIAAQSL